MTANLLRIPDRCYMWIEVDGFPPNARVDLSILAKRDDLVWKFLDDQFYPEMNVDAQGHLEYLTQPVWIDHEEWEDITVCPLAYAPAYNLSAATDCMELPYLCNPD
jgi:hypothetical protein